MCAWPKQFLTLGPKIGHVLVLGKFEVGFQTLKLIEFRLPKFIPSPSMTCKVSGSPLLHTHVHLKERREKQLQCFEYLLCAFHFHILIVASALSGVFYYFQFAYEETESETKCITHHHTASDSDASSQHMSLTPDTCSFCYSNYSPWNSPLLYILPGVLSYCWELWVLTSVPWCISFCWFFQ